MSKSRKFNARRFFDAFQGHENELATLFTHFGRTLPEPFTTESTAREACKDFGAVDPLTVLLYQLNDLASTKGREIIEATAASFAIPGDVPGTDVTHQRAALWLWNADKDDAFESAMDRLAASGVQGGQIALFPGKSAKLIEDDAIALAGFETQLNANIASWKGAERFIVHHYRDGTMLVILVFCERTAEVHWELEPGTMAVKTRIGRPVIQDVLFYDQSTGELEIEAGQVKHREVLRNSFAVGVMSDDSFFPMEQSTRVLNLQKLIGMDFKLPVRPGSGHQVQITGVTLKEFIARRSFTSDFTANRHDVIAMLRAKKAEGLLEKATVHKVRIELILGPGRLDRKSIELSGDNRIKFNRASHADEVYQYLRHWTLMGNRGVEEQSAA
ncbi:MAG: hypothetical protein NTV46_01305 [Verrucomicrobia bacterium]|nr:hypothetical protein [Verrucomicrobiota bacterium]